MSRLRQTLLGWMLPTKTGLHSAARRIWSNLTCCVQPVPLDVNGPAMLIAYFPVTSFTTK